MDFELIAAGEPYFANIPTAQNNQPYLSQGLRVFSGVPANNNIPFPDGRVIKNVRGRLCETISKGDLENEMGD
jgi:hypothetical protein